MKSLVRSRSSCSGKSACPKTDTEAGDGIGKQRKGPYSSSPAGPRARDEMLYEVDGIAARTDRFHKEFHTNTCGFLRLRLLAVGCVGAGGRENSMYMSEVMCVKELTRS